MNTAKSNLLINQTDNNFDDCYEYGGEIGKGRYATVKKCYCKKTQKCYAAKVIKNFRTKNSKLNMNIVENEITALTLARSHSAIVTLYQVFYQRGETILVLEYATEKDLHLYLDIEGAFEEEKACIIVYQVLKAIEFLHSKQILHLDIKPENVLLMTPLTPNGSLSPANDELENDENVQPLNMNMNQPITNNPNINNNNNNKQAIKVKLCDFSFSQVMTPGKHILGMMGTVAYSAPEVLQYEPLTKATDMWSLGVLVHVLLTGYTPFGNGTEKNMQTETNILSVREKGFKCLEEYFENVSPEAQDFIESLLKFKPKLRLTVEDALKHKWFQKFAVATNDNEVMSLETTRSPNNNPANILLNSSNKENIDSKSDAATLVDKDPQSEVNLAVVEGHETTPGDCGNSNAKTLETTVCNKSTSKSNGKISSSTITTTTTTTTSVTTMGSTIKAAKKVLDDKNNNILSKLIESAQHEMHNLSIEHHKSSPLLTAAAVVEQQPQQQHAHVKLTLNNFHFHDSGELSTAANLATSTAVLVTQIATQLANN